MRLSIYLNKLKKFDFEAWYTKQKFDEKKQLEFLSYFATWLPAGSIAACNAIIETGEKISSRKLDVIAAKAIKSSLERGAHVSEGLQKMFNPSVVLLFRVAQESNKPGAMNSILQAYITQENGIKQLKSNLLKSLIYPCLLIGMTLLLNAGIASFLQTVSQSVGSSDFSAMGKITMALGLFVTNYIGFSAAFIVAIYFYGMHFSANNTSRFRSHIDNTFPFSLYKAFCLMRTLRVLGLLIEFKSSVPQALSALSVNANPYVKKQLRIMLSRVTNSGMAVHAAMNTGFLTPELLYRLKMQMEHKDHEIREKAVSHVADFACLEIERKFRKIKFYLIAFAYAIGIFLLIAGFGGYFEVMNLIQNTSNQS